MWWRQLTGSDETLDKTHLIRLAGRFSRRLRGYARAQGIPVVDCRPGEDKHRMAEEYLEKTKISQGVFLILVGNNYSFHIVDRDWGHVTIKLSGHPPFPVHIILNGHE